MFFYEQAEVREPPPDLPEVVNDFDIEDEVVAIENRWDDFLTDFFFRIIIGEGGRNNVSLNFILYVGDSMFCLITVQISASYVYSIMSNLNILKTLTQVTDLVHAWLFWFFHNPLWYGLWNLQQ